MRAAAIAVVLVALSSTPIVGAELPPPLAGMARELRRDLAVAQSAKAGASAPEGRRQAPPLQAAFAGQRGRQGGTGEKPKVDVVQSVGCAERRAGNPESWWITRAAEPRVIQPGIFTTAQIDAAKGAELGANSFQLVGVADFLDAEALLRSGQRKEFTTTENANATGQLREGRKILIKGMLVDAGDAKRINLLTVIALADTCG